MLVWQEEDPWGPFIINAIKVNTMYIINLDYIKTAANEIKIINRSTGRIAARTRWQDNIHQVSSFRVLTCLGLGFTSCRLKNQLARQHSPGQQL